MIYLWLDDVRDPAKFGCIGWDWAKSYEEAIAALKTGEVILASLDHDIGACLECTNSNYHIGDMKTVETTFFNRCPHAKSGYDIICYMEEKNIWPVKGVRVHSMNPVGKARMEQVIRHHYGRTF